MIPLRALLPFCILLAPLGTQSQQARAEANKPLSAIDWLDNVPPRTEPSALPGTSRPPAPRDEPPVARSGTAPDVTVAPLGVSAARVIGLVPPSVTGLPRDLWAGSDPARVSAAIEDLPDLALPAANALLFTLLLAEAGAPEGGKAGESALAMARTEKLIEMGALDPALSLIEQAGLTDNPANFDTFMNISLLSGAEDAGCTRLAQAPHLSNDYGLRVFCLAREGAWQNAAVTLSSAQALGLVDKDTARLLDHFLNPDLFEGAGQHRPPRQMTPLTFRLFEAIGEPLPTGPLPRAYAASDLRDLAGWKAQLEAAERLTRTGALPDNRLLGLYTSRMPAASGGIWDRVAALQRFETALRSDSSAAIAKTLRPAWTAMKQAQLEVPFATLFAEALIPFDLPPRADALRYEIGMLSPLYDSYAVRPPPGPDAQFLADVARGAQPLASAATPLQRAIAAGLAPGVNPPEWLEDAADGRLAETILRALSRLEEGAAGDGHALTESLIALRALGLEDTARRAALQVALLDRAP